jgi:hypothetical protein
MQQDSVVLQELVEVAAIKRDTRFQDRTRRQKDLSAKYGLDRIGISYADTVASKINWEYRAKIEVVELSRPIQGMRINWLSVIGNWNRRSYRTYDAALAFQDAITKHYFDGFTVGLQLNFYTIYKPVQQARLFNIGLLAKKTNNLDDLTVTKLTDETTVVNGSQTRKSADEYNVYTDPVEIYNTIQLPVNYYNFFGKGLAYGWHVYGLADLRSTGKNVLDAGAGFIFGLNTADAKRLFNIELFATYKDINRTLVEDKTTSKWRQLQIGLSVAIPFMLYK